jgi:predicted nucleic acid-binding Zn ribbon protein
MIVECLNCGKRYNVIPSIIKRGKKKFCSNKCRWEYQRPKCPICGNPIPRRDRIYCSRACYADAQRGEMKYDEEAARILDERKAERARNQAEQAGG